MASYVTLHLYNVKPEHEADMTAWFHERHANTLPVLHGFMQVERYERTPEQIMKIPHPWRYMAIYDFEFDHPEIHLPALGSFLAHPRDHGWLETDGSECIWSYGMYSGWKFSTRSNKRPEFTHMMFLPANFVPGMEAEYLDWYENVHVDEVIEGDGFAAMRRGRLHPVQIEPKQFCPGSQIVLAGLQTDDIAQSQQNFADRGNGVAPVGNHGPRSPSASTARTTHYFKKI